MDTSIPRDDQEFIIRKKVEGWDNDLITYALNNKEDSPLRRETVDDFVGSDDAQRRIEKEKELVEKRAEVSREDLIRELNEQIMILRERSEELRSSENDEIGNDTTSNLLKAVRDLADMIDVLESKDDSSGNTVNINRLEQNFNVVEMVQHLPESDKKELAEQLEDDPDVEEFAVVREQ